MFWPVSPSSENQASPDQNFEWRLISMDNSARSYWRANLRLIAGCLSVWFVVSYLFGILLVEPLNRIQLVYFKLGFWFAQQGSIFVFVILIFFYVWRMNKLDHKHTVEED